MGDQAAPAAGGLLDLVLSASPETTVVLIICGICSIVSWYVIGAKWWEFRRLGAQRVAFDDAIARARTVADREQAATALGRSPYAEVVHTAGSYVADLQAAMARTNVTRSGLSLTQLEALTMALDGVVRRAAERAGRLIPWLAIIGATAPLLGLFGTVLGIINAFQGISAGGSSTIASVGPGIADALVATAAGLGAAIPAVVFYNIFTARLERVEGELERTAQETIGALGREGLL
jgi:biopolymer transport protein TolQ